MKVKKDQPFPSTQNIVQLFNEALDHATAKRPALRAIEADPYRWVPAVNAALKPYDHALEVYVFARIENWTVEEIQATDNAYWRVTSILDDLLEAEEDGPKLLKDWSVLKDDGEIFTRENETIKIDGGSGRKKESCCFSLIRFKNIGAKAVRLTVRDDMGQVIQKVFNSGQEKPLTSRDSSGGLLVAGGIGRCISLEALVSLNRRARTWDMPPYTAQLCCDDAAVTEGFQIRMTRGGGIGQTISQLTTLEIKQVVKMEPCPEGERQNGTSTHGRPWGFIRELIGARVSGTKYHYGAEARLCFVPGPNGCRNIAFVQAVKRKVEVKLSGRNDWQHSSLSLGTGDQFHLDLLKDQNTPAYAHVSDLAGGGREMRDFPGVTNPWGRFDLDGKNAHLTAGSQMRVTWNFMTWVVCRDRGVEILGHFTWRVVLTLTIGQDRSNTQGHIEETDPDPVWSDDLESDKYRRIVREAGNHRGWLPS